MPAGAETSATENLRVMEEYEAIKQKPEGITGWDFDRAFDFLEKHPESEFANILKEEMYSTNSHSLKGLSYPSAIKLLKRMPDHPGVPSILNGLKKMEEDLIHEMDSDVISYILEILPEHQSREKLAESLAVKNLTNAYAFVERNPDSSATTLVIQAMFDRDPNIATLLLHERMDHPQVDAIFKGIYSIAEKDVAKLMPDAILFIIDVASDHQFSDKLLEALVEKNYIKAFDFVQNHPEHQLAGKMMELIGKRKPELLNLLNK